MDDDQKARRQIAVHEYVHLHTPGLDRLDTLGEHVWRQRPNQWWRMGRRLERGERLVVVAYWDRDEAKGRFA